MYYRLAVGVTLKESTSTVVASSCENALWGLTLWVTIMSGDSDLSDLSASSEEDSKKTFEDRIEATAKRLYHEHSGTSLELDAMLRVISDHGHRQRPGSPMYKIHISALREALRLAVSAYKECSTCPYRARIEMYRTLVSAPDGIEPSQVASLKELADAL